MAGGGSDEDNPVPVNVVALIDILMCLLLFYMCAAKFAAVEGRMDAWLPLNKGANAGPVNQKILDEVRVDLSWENETTIRRFGSRVVPDNRELEALIVSQYRDLAKNAKGGDENLPSVVLKVKALVPWKHVTDVMDLCRKNQITKIEFAFTEDAAGQDLAK